MKKAPLPTIGTTIRNEFGPTQVLTCLEILSRRRAKHIDRLSSITKLNGVAY